MRHVTHVNESRHTRMLQCVAVEFFVSVCFEKEVQLYCNTLQHTAAHCNHSQCPEY